MASEEIQRGLGSWLLILWLLLPLSNEGRHALLYTLEIAWLTVLQVALKIEDSWSHIPVHSLLTIVQEVASTVLLQPPYHWKV